MVVCADPADPSSYDGYQIELFKRIEEGHPGPTYNLFAKALFITKATATWIRPSPSASA